MALTDFARRLLGFDPLAMSASAQQPPMDELTPEQYRMELDMARQNMGQPMQLPGATQPQASPATIAQPTLDQLYQQDLQSAQLNKLGNLGMLLMAAGQPLTAQQRAAMLAQAPGVMDGAQRDAMNAAQARLYNMRGRNEQVEAERTSALMSPESLRSIGLTPEQGAVLGADGVRKYELNKLMQNPIEAERAQADLERVRAETARLQRPEKTSDPYSDTVARERAQFDARMEQGRKLGLAGEDLMQYASTGKMQTANEKQTQDQANAALFSRRMEQSNQIISDPAIAQYGMGVKGTMNRANAAIPVIGNAFVDPQYQQLDQAKRDFINAALRRESGANINAGEFDSADKQYFPQVGDSPEVLKQKAQNRATAIQGIYDAAAPQYRRSHQVETGAPVDTPAQTEPRVLRRIR